MNSSRRNRIYEEITDERQRQHEKWASKPHDWGIGDASSAGVEAITKVAVLTEEVGEVARAVLDLDDEQLRTELIHVAAVAVAWLEGME